VTVWRFGVMIAVLRVQSWGTGRMDALTGGGRIDVCSPIPLELLSGDERGFHQLLRPNRLSQQQDQKWRENAAIR